MKLVVALAILVASATALAQPTQPPGTFAPGPREDVPPIVELYTFGAGDDVFERFGHAAICLRYHDAVKFPALCWNFGVTDFEDEGGLIWSFLRGEQRFWVGLERYATLYQFYAEEDRDVWRQTLALTPDERRAMEAELWRSANDGYIYDHLFDNCATRLRDAIEAITGRLQPNSGAPYPLSFRDLAMRGFAQIPPTTALADFLLGRELDEHPTHWEAMFYPDVLREQVAARLGATPEALYRRKGAPLGPPGSTGRWMLVLVAIGGTLPLVVARWRRRFERVATVVALLYPSVWGLVVWTVAIVSPIPILRWNEVVLVLVPFDLAVPFLSPARRRGYARVRLAICFLVSALAGIGVLHQPLWVPVLTAVLPLAAVGWPLRARPAEAR